MELANLGVATPFPSDCWEIIRKITDVLRVFKNATTLLSGVYYPTSHLILNQIYLMSSKIGEHELETTILSRMVIPMKQKLIKYFMDMSPVITCSAALNPCLNVSGVEILIEKISYHLDLQIYNPQHISDTRTSFNLNLKNLYQFYLEKYGLSNEATTSVSSSFSTYSSQNPMLNLYNTLREENVKRARADQPSTSEFGRYIGTDFLSNMGPQEFENFDILAWWKGRESQFPVLAAMARDLLTVQASTVASESAFSLSGRVLSIRRTRLTPASLEMCICLKDHLDAVDRIQHISSLEGELDIEEDLHDIEVEQGFSISLSDEEIALDQQMRTASPDPPDEEERSTNTAIV